MDPIIVTLSGEYDIDRKGQLRDQLEEIYVHPYVVIDLTGVGYVDSTCLCEFMRLRQARKAAGLHSACFVVDDRRFGRLFRFLGFDEVFKVVHSLEEAFSPERLTQVSSA